MIYRDNFRSFDMNLLLQRLEDREVVVDILKKFQKDYREFMKLLYENLHNSETFDSLVHKLKGVTLNLTIDKIYKLILSYEDKKIETRELFLDSLDREFKLIFSEIDSLEKDKKLLREEESSLDESYVLEFYKLLDNNRFIKKSTLDIFCFKLTNYMSEDEIEYIRELVELLEYKKAKERVQKIVNL